eukprot:946341-Amphidinium_carterae.1
MDSGDEQQADDTMGQSAQSISSSRTSTSLAETVVMDVQSLMWGSVVSAQCAPMILNLLMTQTAYVSQDHNKGNADHAKDLTFISSTAPILRDTFIPTAVADNLNIHLWFTWLTEAQYTNFKNNGTIPRHKDTRGDS